jgi:hypothetical protein
MLCADMIEASWTETTGRSRRMTALLEDISPSGACLQFETSVPLGAKVHWHSHAQRFSGKVRYCVYREIGYFVGVEFDERSKWSESAFKPKHLLNPQQLITTSPHRPRPN